jgi:hypothetical protein
MFGKRSRPVTKWEILFAIILVAVLIIGGYIGYSYPEHPILGKNRAVFLFLIITYFILRGIEKWLGIDKKIKDEIEKKLKESNTSKNKKDKTLS